MRARNPLKFESLEQRHLPSGNSLIALSGADWAARLSASGWPLPSSSASIAQSTESASDATFEPGGNVSARQFLNTSPVDQIGSARWDWLAGTVWYVPTENMLAYSTPPDLSAPTPVADQ